MDVHSAPRVTIEGGPGWQMDGPAPDEIGVDPGAGRERRWPRPRGAVRVVAVSALLGFAAATALAEWRHDPVGEIDAATLSVSAWPAENDVGFGDRVAIKDGRSGVGMPFELENTGPREIALVSVLVPGTGIATEDLAGRRLAPGDQTRLVLVRPLDCGSKPQQAAPEDAVLRLAVWARTDAGERQVEVRAALNTWMLSDDVASQMCGDLPPGDALLTQLTYRSDLDAGGALLSLQVANSSRHPLTVRLQTVVPWMSARVVDEQGRAVPLPLSLPAGDFSTPRRPDFTQTETWRVEITVPDCRRVASGSPTPGETPLLAADVHNGQESGRATFGHDSYLMMLRLARSACPS